MWKIFILAVVFACVIMGGFLILLNHVIVQIIQPTFAPGDTLVVLVRHQIGVYEPSNHGECIGFECELMRAFADKQRMKIRFIHAKSFSHSQYLLQTGKAHIAALRLPAKLSWQGVQVSEAYLKTTFSLVYPQTVLPTITLDTLPYHAVRFLPHTLSEWLRDYKYHDIKSMNWQVYHGSAIGLFANMQLHEAATILDKQTFLLSRHHFPSQTTVLTVMPEVDVVLHLPDLEWLSWRNEINQFLKEAQQNGLLAYLYEKYYGFAHRLTSGDIRYFRQKLQTDLPRYRPAFEKAQEKTGLDWRLIAALAYQESQWNPEAQSYTGVRGFMMLTAGTMKQLGMQHTDDVEENILAGAKYLAMLKAQLPETILEPDRTWMALAAYNLGFRGLSVGLAFTEHRQADHRYWYEAKRIFPKLKNSDFARERDLSVRGGEAVIMVDKVRAFYEMLCRYAPQ